ncbi:MAG: D-alanyl-D-alanine carboxypeptidase family protein [Pseudomonadota bacterium]
MRLRAWPAADRRTWQLLVFAVLATAFAPPGLSATFPVAPELAAKAHVLLDFHTGRVLSAFRPDARMHPASLTKMLTVYVAFEALESGSIKKGETVRISARARSMGGSRMYLEQGSHVRVIDLLKGVIVQSGNDASVALAEHIAGTESAFVERMNETAKRLGMRRSQFRNPHGWTADGHYTTASDMALLARAMIRRFPALYALHKLRAFVHNGIRQENRNGLLDEDLGVDGIKTGSTEAAGYCLVASAARDGMRLVSVVLAAPDKPARLTDSRKLLEFGFTQYSTRVLYSSGQEISRARVWAGQERDVGLELREPLVLTYPRQRYSDMSATVALQNELEAPVPAGLQVGTLTIRLDDQVLAERHLVTSKTVAEGDWLQRWSDYYERWRRQ